MSEFKTESVMPPFYVVTIGVAAAIIDETIEDTLKLIYGGHLQGILPYEATNPWLVTVSSIEGWLGHEIAITGVQRPEIQ